MRFRKKFVLGIAVGILAAIFVVFLGLQWFIGSRQGQDILYDNEPSRASCDQAASEQKADFLASKLTFSTGIIVGSAPLCDRFLVEIQYGSTDQRQEVVHLLKEKYGCLHDQTGWMCDGVPVSLRNV